MPISLVHVIRTGSTLACLALMIGIWGPAGGKAAEAPAAMQVLAEGRPGTVVEVIDADTVMLDDRREVRLVGIQAPKLPLGRPNFPVWPQAEEAKRFVEDLVLGRPVSVRFGSSRRDRHRRTLAHLVTRDGAWVQGTILEAGFARVYTFADNRRLADEMYALERQARDLRRGIWDDPYYAIRTPVEVLQDLDSFQVVEGTVLYTAKVRDAIYLNFGRDYRTDFTLKIPKRNWPAFERSDADPLSWKGRRIRARGWVFFENGPMIKLTHPEPVEILGAR